MGDVLHYIDFHQLQIENKQYVLKIEERNEELLRLKLTTGSTVQALNTLKNSLNKLMSESDWLAKEIKVRSEQLEKLNSDSSVVHKELNKERATKKKLNSASNDSGGMPQILDYIKQKAEFYEMEQDLKNWERKVELADLGLKRAKGASRAMSRKLK
tara:strand:+ start:773 stop:1243 length:471 start_codon:yes stop_codon:yes gene_type:complete